MSDIQLSKGTTENRKILKKIKNGIVSKSWNFENFNKNSVFVLSIFINVCCLFFFAKLKLATGKFCWV